ncbi:MAG: YfhO family protein [Bacteroides sp.]|nr:YfhO family protein [Bacteroides sp.]
MKLKNTLPDLIAILAFVVISFLYFVPAVFEGRALVQHDAVAGLGVGQEAKEYYERTGERTRWTNALFGGMPTYQISPSYESTGALQMAEKAYHLFLPTYVWYLFVMLVGFYILARVMGMSVPLSFLGGVLWAFSSYFFILISAGHIWKLVTLAYIPPTIAGIMLVYKGRYLAGALLTAFFGALQIMANHIQMSYYFLFPILFLVVAWGVEYYRRKDMTGFLKATGVLMVAGLVSIAINSSSLYHTYQYTKETMRGKSELVHEGVRSVNQSSDGLDRDYITQWSYGIGETFTLLVPNTKGGASVPLAANEKAMEKANPMYRGIYSQLGQYWGDQPGTSGPVYVGAFVLLLFFLGIFLVKGPLKWALVAGTIFSILLSWGKNFMPLTDFFIDYIPMYSKFRAVSSILVIAEFTIPLLAILGLKEIIQQPEILKKNMKYLYISFGLTGGIALLFALAPQLFFSTYIPAAELNALQSGIPPEQLAPLLENLKEVRVSLFTADAWRSFFIIVLGTGLLVAFLYGKLRALYLVVGIIALSLGDMWGVNKRYLNDGQFVPETKRVTTFQKSSADEYILEDPALSYRVLNLATNTFNENNTSYWHKSVGGYHAAKLRRYQELIEYHLSPEIQNLYRGVMEVQGEMSEVDPAGFRVINMLDTKYMIFPGGEGALIPVENPYAYGNAWFVENIRYVDTANQEIKGLYDTDLLTTAIVNKEFSVALKGVTSLAKDSATTIELVEYEPNRLTYRYSSNQDAVLVFSEIYYPGWKATVDGDPVEIGRADYVLRVLAVPAGEHTLEMSFHPASISVTETLAYCGLALILLGVIGLVIRYRKNLAL